MSLSVEQWIEFAQSGNQQKIVLNGQLYQGWIMEIVEDALLMSTGYSDKVGKDFWLSFDELADAQLFFWDTQSNQWQTFHAE